MPAHTGLEFYMSRGITTPWFRMAEGFFRDGRVRKAKAMAVWPWVLSVLKRGNGFAREDDLDPEVCADDMGLTLEQASIALAGLRRVGLLVEVDGAWTADGWTSYQPDPTASDRMAKMRERNRRVSDAAEARASTPPRGMPPPVEGTEDDHPALRSVTDRYGNKRSVTRDVTGQDKTCPEEEKRKESSSCSPNNAPAREPAHVREADHGDDNGEDPIQAEQERRDCAMLRAAHERRQANASPTALAASQTPAAVTVDPDMAAAFTAWRRTDAGAAPLSSAVVDKMRRVIAEHGAARVIKAIDAWVGTANGTKFATVNYIVGACKGIANDEAEAEARAAERERWQAEEEERRREEEERREEYAHLTPEQRAANIEMVQGLFAEMDRLLSGRSPRAVATH